MSTKSTKSAASVDAIAAIASAKVVALSFSNVPSLGNNPGADQSMAWQSSIAECVQAGDDFTLKTREYTQQALVMILMDAQLQTLDYYKSELARLKITQPQKQDTITHAFALHLRLDVGLADKDLARNNSKKLFRFANAAHRLNDLARENLGSRGGRIDITYDPDGVLKLLEIVVAEKGINELAKIGGKPNKQTVKPIAISAEGLSQRQEEMLGKRLAAGSELKIAVENPSGKLELIDQVRIPAAAMPLIYPQLKLAEPRIQFLNELFAVGAAVAEEKTDILVNADIDDPNDGYAPRRLSSRQYVFGPDGITISPILRESSVIVAVKPKVDLLGMKALGHAKFHTSGRRQAEVNIAGNRADAFDYSMGSPAGTEGVARITLTTPVAVKNEDQTKDVGMLIEHVRSQQGNLPLIITAGFARSIELGSLPGLLDKMESVASTGKKLIAEGRKVKVTVERDRLSIGGATKDEKISLVEEAKTAKLSIRVDDFMAVTAALKSIELVEPLRLTFGDGMMVISADTKSAAYTIYLPGALSDGTRDNRYMQKLDPVAWRSTADADAVATTEAE